MARPETLVIDDGELLPARTILLNLGVDFRHLRGDEVPTPVPESEKLFMISARLAVALEMTRSGSKSMSDPVWLAFVPGESRSQRQFLRRAGFDFLVPEHVHPGALGLLIRRALYRGANRQRVMRVACGDQVTFVTTLMRHNATLLDLSPRGCRLLTRKPPRRGADITVQIPQDDGSPLQLRGTVVRKSPGLSDGGEADEFAVGVSFAQIEGAKRAGLKALLHDRLSGPRALPPGSRRQVRVQDEKQPTLSDMDSQTLVLGDEDQRLTARARYRARVDAFCAGNSRVLLARDLSARGVRVESNDKLRLGERLRLAMPVGDRGEVIFIEAHVERDDGPAGMALLFDWMEPDAQRSLGQTVASLPQIERVDEPEGYGQIPISVVSSESD